MCACTTRVVIGSTRVTRVSFMFVFWLCVFATYVIIVYACTVMLVGMTTICA